MSTPTHSNHNSQPGSASKKATGHVTTPSHLGLASPAPRSVPSPATTRKDHAGKTPINHPTASSTGSKTLGSTPMVPNLSQTGMTVSSSPGAHNGSFGTPGALGLGVDLGSTTPGQMSNLLGGTGMIPTMSDLGLSSRSGKKNEDEERRDKMRKVLRNIGRRKGRVSQDGIQRIGRRVGLDIDMDDDAPEQRARNVGNREFTMAGKAIVVDIALKQHIAQSVKVQLMGNDPNESILPELASSASKVLLNDLKATDGVLLHSNLDGFARNLHSLAHMDILSYEGKVNCFKAIDGIYKSLQTLYELELKSVKSQQSKTVPSTDSAAADEVTRRRSGRPAMCENDRFGLAIDYWSPTKVPSVNNQDSQAMDVDGQQHSETSHTDSLDMYRLRIEAESASVALDNAIKISNEWLPESFEIPAPDSGEGLPWGDPPPTFTANGNESQGNTMAVEGSPRIPELRFVAQLDPPVVVPWSVAAMLPAVGLELPLLLPGPVAEYAEALLRMNPQSLSHQAHPVEAQQTVCTMRENQEVDVTHRYVLDVSKPDNGYKVEKLYFSHPKQLIQILPTLRQWAHMEALVRGAFGSIPAKSPPPNDTHTVRANGHANGVNGDAMDVDTLGQSLVSSSLSEELLVTVGISTGLSTSPSPTLSVTFPDAANSTIGNAIVQILPNANLIVTSYEGVGEKDGDGDGDGNGDSPSQDDPQSARAKKLAKALEVCGDLGVWVEWMRQSR